MKTYIIGALMLCGANEPARPANNLVELGSQINACFGRQGEWWAHGEITVNFSLRRDGSLIGRPRITYLRPQHDEATRQLVVEQAAEAVARCFPASLTEGLGGAVAGRMFSWRFTFGPPEKGI
jgi:hypothetical protein